jgi:hypothetical protein
LFGSFLPSLLVGQHHQLYSGIGADIVMESISQVTHRLGWLDLDEAKRHGAVGHPSCLRPSLTFTLQLDYQGHRRLKGEGVHPNRCPTDDRDR